MSRQNVDEAAAGLLDRLKTAMAARGVNMKELSERVGVPYRTLQGYLLGKRTIPIHLLRMLSRELNANAHWLLCGYEGLIDRTVLDEEVLDLFHQMLAFGIPRDKQAAAIEYLYTSAYRHHFAGAPHSQRPRGAIDHELRKAADPDHEAKRRVELSGV
jgi:transcriptional regulator with XRE-family HTH domain